MSKKLILKICIAKNFILLKIVFMAHHLLIEKYHNKKGDYNAKTEKFPQESYSKFDEF